MVGFRINNEAYLFDIADLVSSSVTAAKDGDWAELHIETDTMTLKIICEFPRAHEILNMLHCSAGATFFEYNG